MRAVEARLLFVFAGGAGFREALIKSRELTSAAKAALRLHDYCHG
jgi:hypothetical protein